MGRMLIGLGLVALGLVYLGDRADLWDAGDVISDWWPLVIIAIGVAQLTARPRPWVGSSIVIAIGVVLLLGQLDVVPAGAWELFWPAVLIGIGAWLLISRLGGRGTATRENNVNLFAIFGEAKSASNSTAFAGGTVTGVLGSATLDLRGAGLASDGAEIDATGILGGAEVIVPRGWDVRVNALPVFGGVEDKTDRDQSLPADAPRLTVKGLALFGGVEVKHAR